MSDLATVAGNGGAWRLFVDAGSLTTAERVPLLPKPGTYAHPEYGEMDISAERIAAFVSNVNSGLYQQSIPIDAEHESKLSGALGWFREASVNEDGSADAIVEWTDRGKALLDAGGYRYVSPEWYEMWTDPATGMNHNDVLIGLALTTRPFFKDDALRPLVATEGRLDALAKPAGQTKPHAAIGKEKNMENTAQEFGELRTQFAELTAKVAATEAARTAAEERATAAEDRVGKLEADSRHKSFTDEVMGRSDASAIKWFGDASKHIAVLEALPTEETRQMYVDQQRETAKRITASIGKEIGSDAPGESVTAWGAIEAKSKAYAAEKGVTFETAFTHVMATESELRRRYVEERG